MSYIDSSRLCHFESRLPAIPKAAHTQIQSGSAEYQRSSDSPHTHEQEKRGLLDLLEMYHMQGTGPVCRRFCHYPICNGGQKVTITASWSVKKLSGHILLTNNLRSRRTSLNQWHSIIVVRGEVRVGASNTITYRYEAPQFGPCTVQMWLLFCKGVHTRVCTVCRFLKRFESMWNFRQELDGKSSSVCNCCFDKIN